MHTFLYSDRNINQYNRMPGTLHFLAALLCLCAIFCIPRHLAACVNEEYDNNYGNRNHRTTINGDIVYIFPGSGIVAPKAVDTAQIRRRLPVLLRDYRETGSVRSYSDYGAGLIYLGEYASAALVYHRIEQRRPGRYATASNLGTIYELTGKPDSALHWMRRAVKLNPQSHGGSEWIHIRILEYKTGRRTSLHSSVLGLDFGVDDIPRNAGNYALDTLEQHLRHQLSERMYFVQPPDNIVGSLYTDLGNVLALTADLETALEAYRQAERYGFRHELLQSRIDRLASTTTAAGVLRVIEPVVEFTEHYWPLILFWNVIGVLLGLLLSLALMMVRRVQRFVRRRQFQRHSI